MATRLEGHVKGRAPGGVTGLIERQQFRMRAPESGVMTPPDNLALLDNDRAYHRVRLDLTSSSFC
jgi:hypothetical protein